MLELEQSLQVTSFQNHLELRRSGEEVWNLMDIGGENGKAALLKIGVAVVFRSGPGEGVSCDKS